jgi:NADPH:quinone reductase-like Zn-dependent oxidoreductase
VVLDVFARQRAADYVRVLRRGGSYFFVGGPVRRMLALVAGSPLIGLTTGRRIRLLFVRPNRTDLLEVAEMCLAGTIRPPIGAVVPFENVADAMRALVEGRALGKTVIRVAAS